MPTGKGWIGACGETVAWLSLGPLDREAVREYWKGPLEEETEPRFAREFLEQVATGNEGICLAPVGTPFQTRVWAQLLQTPFASTVAYGELAGQMDLPGQARAVGSAVAANPIAWLIPCHRIVPASGGVGSYRWGSEAKDSLLAWERLRNENPGKRFIASDSEGLQSMLRKAQRFEDIANIAGDIAHDLNNLMAPIRMATELLKRKLDDQDLNRYVGIIESSTGRARSVIQEILSFSKETENTESQVIPIKPLVSELETMARETFPKRLRFAFDYGPDNPQVRIDPTQLHRAILNILVNARDAVNGEGQIGVRISQHHLDIEVSAGERSLLPGPYACISVSDSGCGIPDEIRDRIFDPFFTTKPKEEGTGLGLASVYGIISRAGGFIDLETYPGKGSTFHIFLPKAG
jgi:O-6-methylguanine DNA methyltransferase